jgi:hypothetical protein
VVECQLPKLDAVGSNPISRSIFSITYKELLLLAEPTFRGNEVSEPSEPINRRQL